MPSVSELVTVFKGAARDQGLQPKVWATASGSPYEPTLEEYAHEVWAYFYDEDPSERDLENVREAIKILKA